MTTTPVSFGGLESGLNTSEIISAEMQVFEQPLDSLQTQQSSLNTQISDYQSINSQLLSLQQAADVLANPVAYDEAFSASSSNSSIATGTIASGSAAGSVTLAVDQLATGSTQISQGTVASTDDVVASGNILVGAGGLALGLDSFTAGSGLSVGAHSISVTQASSGATVAAGTSLAASTTVTGANDQLDVDVNGSPLSVTIASGTYTQAQLAQAITQGSGGTLSASVSSGGQLSIATTQQGSASSLQVTGGSALGTLGLSSGSTVYGTDGQIDVDGTTTTVNDIAGTGTTQVTLDSGDGGTLTASISGGLSVGSMTAQNISVGDGSLSSVVAGINQADTGVTATALQVGTNQYALEVTSNSTGTVGAATVDTQAFSSSSLGALQTTTAAQDAIVSIGGTGGFHVTSQTNTVTGLLPGVSVNLAQVSASPVTITVAPDGSQMVSQVSSLVSAANQVLSSISTDTAYNESTNTAAPLNGQTSLNELAQQVLSLVGQAVGSSGSGSDGTAGESAGLAITSSGTITFNQNAFEAAYDKNPSAVQAMFTEGGTFSASGSAYDGQVSVAGATDGTTPGDYAVSISQSASQAVDLGSSVFAAPTSTVGAAESYTVSSGSNSATYAVSAGESVADVISGLNGALAAAGLDVSASMHGSAGSYQVQLSSADYGSAATFGISTTGADQLGVTASGSTYAGTDVAGTIDGQTAIGSGQILSLSLSLSLSDPSDPANGLVLTITTPGITTATSLGTVDYKPGMAESLANLAEQSTISPKGQIADTISGLKSTLSNVTGEIALQQQLVATQQATLTQEFTNLEETLSQLSSESQFLSDSSSSSSSSSSGLSSLSSSSSGSSSSSAA
jgi:flagellar hook-associated protein 2